MAGGSSRTAWRIWFEKTEMLVRIYLVGSKPMLPHTPALRIAMPAVRRGHREHRHRLKNRTWTT